MKLLKGHSAMRRCQVAVVADGPVVVRAFPPLVDQVLINLLLNAADATKGAGPLEVRVRREGPTATIEVHDDGPGVPAEQEAKLFSPFGTGLGLVSVRECARMHCGQAGYQRSPRGGACLTVTLPLTPPGT